MMTSQVYSQGVHLTEKSDFTSLRLYIEQEVSKASLQQLVETIQNSNDSEVRFNRYTTIEIFDIFMRN